MLLTLGILSEEKYLPSSYAYTTSIRDEVADPLASDATMAFILTSISCILSSTYALETLQRQPRSMLLGNPNLSRDVATAQATEEKFHGGSSNRVGSYEFAYISSTF